MFKGCKRRYRNTEIVRQHQPRDHTKAEKIFFRKHRATHCACGARRFKVSGQDHNKCPQCNRIWCTIGDCFASYSYLGDLKRHNCPFEKSQFSDRCSKCGYSPKIRNQLVGRCPNCRRFWCLCAVCSFESDTLDSMNRHLAMVHLIF